MEDWQEAAFSSRHMHNRVGRSSAKGGKRGHHDGSFDVRRSFGSYECKCTAWEKFKSGKDQYPIFELFRLTENGQGIIGTLLMPDLLQATVVLAGSRKTLEQTISALEDNDASGVSKNHLARSSQTCEGHALEFDGLDQRSVSAEESGNLDPEEARLKAFEKNSFRAPKFWFQWSGLPLSPPWVDNESPKRWETNMGYLVFSGNDCRKFQGTINCSALGWKDVALKGHKTVSKPERDIPVAWNPNGTDLTIIQIAGSNVGSPAQSIVTLAAAVSLGLQANAAAIASPAACAAANANQTYDYIVVGSGAGGIPIADRLSEAGHTVLLIEKGPPSSGRWGGTMKPKWLDGTNLTRFDVPGLSNEIWSDPKGIVCTDVDQMAGCVLGGGTAVNSGLWWKPHPADWDFNFPDGWKNTDVAAATQKLFSRIPGTTVPSTDGKLYLQQGFDMLSSGLNASGWKYIVPNDHPDQKNRTYGHSTFMFSGGERGGPLATYLLSASQRKEFTLWTNTIAKRVVRTGGHATGVELECNGGSGYSGVVSVTPKTGRVIVSAGAFGSAKLLMRSGIGPTDQLNVVKSSSDGPTMISQDSWINLPVGYNLDDHVGTDVQVSHPNVVFYDFYGAYNNPVQSDAQAYLKGRTGILTQAAPNVGPMFWEIITGADGRERHLHWQSRVEGSQKTSMTITQYLGTGAVSRGRMKLSSSLNTVVSTAPYLHDDNDKAAIIKGIENLQDSLKGISGLTWIAPKPGQTVTQFVNSLPATTGARCANHWIGTSKLGLDDGRVNNGTSVIDTNTKVYGMDNLFVVDASIFPGHITGNPSAAIIIASEHAATKILALA
ncbi:uncharacterized protein JN550_000692 [Neoarthrinium moseri]|uniref:uncharacterized protein n=1 Tax=Neoarthrinium moseri TaxID=1658444 RepID=UPI001FDD4983|nr:uncharacterized protein JN550_000692 [Neoarthrinium moseri]KAI1878510.1 hypothetical protein JN550_000692 [Neoarthrinium moseri]